MKISAPIFGCEILGGHFSAKVERNPKKNKQNLLLESPRIAKMAILPFEGGLVHSTFCLTTLGNIRDTLGTLRYGDYGLRLTCYCACSEPRDCSFFPRSPAATVSC